MAILRRSIALLVLSEIPEGRLVQVVNGGAVDPVEARFQLGSLEVDVDSLPSRQSRSALFSSDRSRTYRTAGRFPRLINCTDGQFSTETQSSYESDNESWQSEFSAAVLS